MGSLRFPRRFDRLAPLALATLLLATVASPARAQTPSPTRESIIIFPVFEGVHVEGAVFSENSPGDGTVVATWDAVTLTLGSATIVAEHARMRTHGEFELGGAVQLRMPATMLTPSSSQVLDDTSARNRAWIVRANESSLSLAAEDRGTAERVSVELRGDVRLVSVLADRFTRP